MFAEKQRFLLQVSAKLGLQEKELQAFPEPKVTKTHYVCEIIYKMTKIDFNSHEKTVTFPYECKNVKDKQKALIHTQGRTPLQSG